MVNKAYSGEELSGVNDYFYNYQWQTLSVMGNHGVGNGESSLS
jgi:hypothetical protein